MTTSFQLVRDILNIKKSDFFVVYGLNQESREIVNYMRGFADVSTGIAVDNIQFEESEYLRTPIYRGFPELGAKKLFDKVYCEYDNLPQSKHSFKEAFDICFDLCEHNGMVLMSGLTDWTGTDQLLRKRAIPSHWFLRETDDHFDLLYKKPKY
jgi:hypothetical protein